MNSRDPKLTALMFNQFINAQDIDGLASLMTDDHSFIDRKNHIDKGRKTMLRCWVEFFSEFPQYKNTFTKVESLDDLVVLTGYAEWSREGEPDDAIWTARIRDDLVAEWRIYDDTQENRRALGVPA